MNIIPKVNDFALAQIGFRVSGDLSETDDSTRADIEQTLLSVIGHLPEDYRLASILLSWIKVHGNYVIAEKLVKQIKRNPWRDSLLPAWMTLAAAWAVECGYHKWKKLMFTLKPPVYFYAPEISEAAIARKGSIPWLDALGLRVPKDSFRVREGDVFSPEELIAANLQYKNRYLYGASWRADIITAVQRGISSPMEISRTIGCSYEPAHRISHEYLLARKT